MSFGINVKADLSQVERMFGNVRRNVVPQAAARATNRAIDRSKTEAVRAIADSTGFKQKDIRPRMRVRGATPERLIAYLEALPYSPNLQRFNARQNRVGTTAKAWEARKVYRHAFIMPSGRVVTRTTNKRFPLKGLRGPSLPRTFAQERVIVRLEAVARQTWRSEFERELARRLSAA